MHKHQVPDHKSKGSLEMGKGIKAGVSPDRLDRIDPVMERFIETTHIPGIVTLVYRRGELVHNKSYGLLGPDGIRPMRTDSIFRIYSMTKPITCTALLMLYEKGKLRLSDPVSRFLPAFRDLKVYAGSASAKDKQVNEPGASPTLELVDLSREITIHDLLTHTSGITSPWQEYGPVEELYRKNKIGWKRPLSEMVDDILRMPLAFQPGSAFRYGLSHDVIARLIEIISGLAFDRFLKEHIFEPLKMVDSGFYVPKEKHNRFAAMYGVIFPKKATRKNAYELAVRGEVGWISDPEKDLEYRKHKIFRGGHGLVSTASDYFRFCRALLNQGEVEGERILERNTVELMTTNHLPESLLPYEVNGRLNRGYGYGLGLRVLMDPAQRQIPGSVGEIGWAGLAGTYFWIDPAEELIGIIMAQFMPDVYRASDDFRTLVHQAIID
jgi:CubicO group peptidase (beta-lactamase class C family)